MYVGGDLSRDGAVIFVGMDTPELPWSEVLAAKNAAEKDGKAYICPGKALQQNRLGKERSDTPALSLIPENSSRTRRQQRSPHDAFFSPPKY